MNEKRWINIEPEAKKVPWFILKAALTLLLLGIVISIFMFANDVPVQERPDIDEILTMNFPSFIFLLLLFVIIEEIIFRLIPIVVGMLIIQNLTVTIILCLISSVIFGYLHGNEMNIMSQGVIGFGFCMLYLKLGGRKQKTLKPFLSLVAIHFLFNFILLTPVYFMSM